MTDALINVRIQLKNGKFRNYKTKDVYVDWEFENDDRLSGDGDADYFRLFQKL